MILLTDQIRRSIAPIGAQDGKGDDAVVYVKFFTPDAQWTWYTLEASAVLEDGAEVPFSEVGASTVKDVLFFGLVHGLETEYGYYTLSQLREIKGPLGLGVERDLHFGTKTIGEAKQRMAH